MRKLKHLKHVDKRITAAVILGNTAAWGDFALYAYFSPVLSRVFFPFTYTVSEFLYFIVFALGFLFRPIGAALAGGFADRYGRKNTLLATVILSAIFTTLMGCLPSYHAIGILSPLLLTLLRILQTMAIAAEPTNSSALLLEYARKDDRGLITSSVMSGIFLGFFLGIFSFLIVSYFLTPAQLKGWGWRLPFISSMIVGILVSWFLLSAKESPLFLKKQEEGEIIKNPISLTFKTQAFSMFIAFGYASMFAVGNYFLLGYMPNLMTHNLKISLVHTNLYISITLFVSALLIPFMGYLSDRVGRRPIMITGAILFIVMSYPILYMLKSGVPSLIVVGLVVYGIALALTAAVMPTAISEMFPFAVRCTGGALGYNVSLVIFGGTTPVIAGWLYGHTKQIASLFWYISVVALIHLLFLLFSKETKNNIISK